LLEAERVPPASVTVQTAEPCEPVGSVSVLRLSALVLPGQPLLVDQDHAQAVIVSRVARSTLIQFIQQPISPTRWRI
jgi:hypothetical protein